MLNKMKRALLTGQVLLNYVYVPGEFCETSKSSCVPPANSRTVDILNFQLVKFPSPEQKLCLNALP